MKVVKPIVIGDAQLVSSSAPEADYPAYNTVTDYAVGARVVRVAVAAPDRSALDASRALLDAAWDATAAALARVSAFRPLGDGKFNWWIDQALSGHDLRNTVPNSSGERNAQDAAFDLLARQAAQQQADADWRVQVAAYDSAIGTPVAHVIWESVQTPNTGHIPGSDALYWAAIAPTNRWAMFDGEISTQTVQAGSLTVVLKPGCVNSLALFGLEGASLDVTVRDGLAGPVVYSRTVVLDGTLIADWYQYFFEPSVQLGEVVLTDLPPYGNAHVTVSLGGSGSVKCGILVAGTAYALGDTQYGASAGIIDYSRKDTSATGTTTFVRRRYSKRMSAPLMLQNAQLNKVQRVLADLRATPCAWIGTDAPGFEPLTIFGFYRDFSIDVAYPAHSLCSLEVEGLT